MLATTLNAPDVLVTMPYVVCVGICFGCCCYLALSAGVTAVNSESGKLGLPGTSVTSNDLTRLCMQEFSRSASPYANK